MDSRSNREVWGRFHISDGTFEWAELLERRRVVDPAEGGSGKSTEFQQQARAQAIKCESWGGPRITSFPDPKDGLIRFEGKMTQIA
jgi:hypothetical protein